jgi:hypothetical protein
MKMPAMVTTVLCGCINATSARDVAVFYPGAKTCGQLLSLDTIAERVARSPRVVLISNAEVPSAYLFKEASGFIAGYLTAINVDYARHDGIGSVIDIVRSIRNLRRSGRGDELVPTKSAGRYY